MQTVTKRADELKPGDVLSLPNRDIVLRVIPEIGILRVEVWDIDQDTTNNRWLQRSELVQVEAPALTPAQQHAEELLTVVERLAARWSTDSHGKSITRAAKDLLIKIKPPEPPTLKDALYALDSIDTDHMPPSALDVLARARRTGLLK